MEGSGDPADRPSRIPSETVARGQRDRSRASLKIRFLADANFNQRTVAGLLLREPEIDFAVPLNVIPDGMSDLQVLELGTLGRVVVTHDVRTMPGWFEYS